MRLAFLVTGLAAMLIAAGVWNGKWSSSQNENGGEIRITLEPEAQVVFTLSGREVKTKIASQKKDGSSFSLEYDFDLEGYRLRSSLTGKIQGEAAEGTYRTKSLDDASAVDSGTFQVSLRP